MAETEGKINHGVVKSHLLKNGMLSEKLIRKLISGTKRIFDRETNMLKINGEVVIIGDIHG